MRSMGSTRPGNAGPWAVGRLAASSVVRFLTLVSRRSLLRSRDRLGAVYRIDGRGHYRVFRETVRRDAPGGPECVLVVGFRLRGIGRNALLHALFERVCIVTTPFWSGFAGFSTKLWLVDPDDRSYLGIYRWYGEAEARTYIGALVPVLELVSDPADVWYELHVDAGLEPFLASAREPVQSTRSSLVMRQPS